MADLRLVRKASTRIIEMWKGDRKLKDLRMSDEEWENLKDLMRAEESEKEKPQCGLEFPCEESNKVISKIPCSKGYIACYKSMEYFQTTTRAGIQK